MGVHRIAISFIVTSMLALPASLAQDPPPDPPYVEGVVVNAKGDPLEGVQYWANGSRLGEDGEGGKVIYTGMRGVRETGEDGRFRCEYEGRGRDETATDISFQHGDYAPAWLVNVNQVKGPYTVTLERGVKLSGIAADNGYRGSNGNGPLSDWPLHLRLDVAHRDVGGFVTRIPIDTESDGWFTVRIPSNYWSCHYWLHFAGTKTDLEFPEGEPLPKLRINVSVEVETYSSAFDD